MKKLLIVAALLASSVGNAYTINGQYATLISCTWGQLGYQWGNIGTYQLGGQQVQVFFGGSYCEY